MTCPHSYEIRTVEAVYFKPVDEWLYHAGPFYRNEKNERCLAHGNAFYSIEDAIEELTLVVCHRCGEGLL
ncbi:MAG: hypothetical protein IIA59_01030 [Candidatus Marinimicrobia bacterium]|nr:hypothetical protein [Candidatus Neomarinimicrobiota bacterium]